MSDRIPIEPAPTTEPKPRRRANGIRTIFEFLAAVAMLPFNKDALSENQKITAIIALFGAFIGLLYAAVTFIGIAAAQGVSAGLLNWGVGELFIWSIVKGLLVPLIIVGGGFLLSDISALFGKPLVRIFGEKAAQNISGWLGLILLALALFPTAPYYSYLSTKKAQREAFLAGDKNLSEVSASLQANATALGDYRSEVKTTLDSVSSTKREIESVERALTATLAQFERQSAFVDGLLEKVQENIKRQELLEARHAELQKLLDGKAPITKEDLDKSNQDGIITGLLMSIVSAVIWYFLKPALNPLLRKFKIE